MKTYIKVLLILFVVSFTASIFEIPYIMHPFSKHGAYDWGYYYGSGGTEWPTTCPDMACKVHHKGFWEEFLSTN